MTPPAPTAGSMLLAGIVMKLGAYGALRVAMPLFPDGFEQWRVAIAVLAVCQALDCRVVLLAFFAKGDLKGDCEGTATVIRRLREVAPKAEKAGVILGIESWLSAEEHVAIIDAVFDRRQNGSPEFRLHA